MILSGPIDFLFFRCEKYIPTSRTAIEGNVKESAELIVFTETVVSSVKKTQIKTKMFIKRIWRTFDFTRY